MTYSSGVPAAGQSPGLWPAQGNVNFLRLQQIMENNHQFNLTQMGNDGFHNIVALQPQTPSGDTPAYGRLYSKNVAGAINLYYADNSVPFKEYQLTPTPVVIIGTSFFPDYTPINIFSASYNYTAILTVYENGTVSQQIKSFIADQVSNTSGISMGSSSGLSFISLMVYSAPNWVISVAVSNGASVGRNFTWVLQIFRTN